MEGSGTQPHQGAFEIGRPDTGIFPSTHLIADLLSGRVRVNAATREAVACFSVLLAFAVMPGTGHAQVLSPAAFSSLQTELVPRTSAVLEPATLRSRVVGMDTQHIAAARQGREVLRLNLFDDAVIEAQIDRVRPTRSGYFISGRPAGMDWGEVRLVVNGPVMVGTVVTPEATFTIRWDGSGRHVIRQIDPSAEQFEYEDDDVIGDDLPPADPSQAGSTVAPLSPTRIPATHFPGDTPTEDGSEVRVLVVYTPAMQARQGGAAGIQALIDLMIHSANQAFEISGVEPRLVLAHTALVNYVEERIHTDLRRLTARDDGYMDEVHKLRDEHAADLVHLLISASGGAAGTAGRTTLESLTQESYAAFAVTATSSEETFTHEIGHNFGLRHDRYVNSPFSAIYPYAFGYVNNRAFEPDATGARWRTVMAYSNRCRNAGFACPRLLRFSNPDQTYNGDPLGVPADDPATGPDGPADARLTLNRSAPWVGSFRSEACTDFTVSPDAPVAPAGGGEFIFKVETAPGCLWEASSQSDFLVPPSDNRRAGARFVSIGVEENHTGAERSGTLAVAGTSIEVRQLATDAGICGRTPTVVRAIAGQRPCDEVTDQHLSEITRLSVSIEGLTSLKTGDFAGLSDLEVLSLERNELAELPEDLFAGLSSLKRLNLGSNLLTQLPEGLFAGLSSLEYLWLHNNRLTELPEGLFAGLSSLNALMLDRNRLSQLSQNQFAGLANLEKLELNANEFSALPDGLFAGLGHLKSLTLADNRLSALSNQSFTGLTELETLDLFENRLLALPEGAFAGLAKLKVLKLGRNPFESLPAPLFSGLSGLEELNFWDADLTGLPDGIFASLSNLASLDIYSNRIGELPPGLFSGLARLSHLVIGRNDLTTLPDGVFSGLSNLRELNLFGNQLSSLPDGVFSGLTSLERLYLGRNLVDPLSLAVSLENAGDNQFKAVAPTGAPFALAVTVSSDGGTIEGHAGTVTIPAGAVESSPISVTRIAGTQQRVTVDIGTLPGLPGTHSGYVLEKFGALPLSVLASIDMADATLGGLSLSDGTLEPVFDPGTSGYTASVPHAAASITVTPVTSNQNATATWLDGRDAALPDADANTDGHQVTLSSGENVIKVVVTAEDGTSVRTYTLVVTRQASICNRTAQVADGIVQAVSGVDSCGYVSKAHLEGITTLDLSNQSITSLQSGDFAGLSALQTLRLTGNQLTALPADVFSGLAALEILSLRTNQLESLPDNVFAGLSELRLLYLSTNRLSSLPTGTLSDLTKLETIWLSENRISDLPAGTFSGLSSLEEILLIDNELTSLPVDVFSGLSALRTLWLSENALESLPAGVFSGLSSLSVLLLSNNELTSLPAGVFGDLSALRSLFLSDNSLPSLPAGAFTGLSSLQTLLLGRNRLRTLPDGLFAGLTNLRRVRLEGNAIDPIRFGVSLEKTGTNQFKAVAPLGAPFGLAIPVSVSAGGAIEGDVEQLSIPIGAVESAPVGVSRVPGATDAVTVDIGTLPGLVGSHRGYIPVKDRSLPLLVFPSLEPADATLSALSLSNGTLDPSFAPETTSYTASVPHAMASITVNVTPNDSQATLAYFDADDQALADADSGTQGHQANLVVGDNTVKVRVTSGDRAATRTYVIVVTRAAAATSGGICSRTAQVREAIVAAVAGVSACADVTDPHLAEITSLDLSNRNISSLQSGDFAGLSALQTLRLTGNQLTVLPDGVFSGLSSLEELLLSDNELTGLPAGVFSGLSSLDDLRLNGNRLTDLPVGLLSGLSALQTLQLHGNRLSTLPDGLFTGLTNLGTLTLGGNTVNPLPLSVSLEKVGTRQFKAVAPAGAPFALVLPVSSAGGTIDGSATTVTIPAGAVQSAAVGVSRAPGDTGAVTVDIGTLPALSGTHSGYVLEKDTALPLSVLASIEVTEAALSGLSLSDGALDPVFDRDTTYYTASVPHAVASITVNATQDDPQATLAYLDADDQALADADSGTQGHQTNLVVGDNTVKVRVTSGDRTATRTYVIVVTRAAAATSGGICSRTAQVRDAIVAAVAGISACADVTEPHLAEITSLDLSNRNISSLQSGDFAGLSTLQTLRLTGNQLTVLPDGVFSGLSQLKDLSLSDNRIGSLRANTLSGLSSLEELLLSDNELTGLPAGVFSGLSSLDDLRLNGNRLTDIPVGLLTGLSALQTLQLHGNRLSTLPDGLFAGLANLGTLTLGSNTVNPMPIPVSLEKVGNNQFRAVAHTGAPFALTVPVSSARGTIDGRASTVSIPAGAIESAAVGVSRAPADNDAVTVDIGTLPALPGAHTGYVLQKDAALPLTVLPSLGSSDTRLRSLSLSDGTLDPVFAADMSSYTASVPHAVASVTVNATPNESRATLRFVDADGRALADADAETDGHQVSLSSGENVIKVVVTAESRTSIRTYTVVMTRQASICTRTDAVVDAIVQAVSGVDSCGYVSKAHLASITTLDLSGQSITSLQSGDFAGLPVLQTLHLNDNRLTELPADVFSLLDALETLSLADNQLDDLPVAVLSRLTALRFLYLNANRLGSLPNGTLYGLSKLEALWLHDNRIGSLRANAFSGLSSLEELLLNGNELTELPTGVFSGLSSLDDLRLNGNRLTSLPAGVLSGLSALRTLQLHGNRLSTLPDGLFAGLNNLGTLTLGSNTVNPMPIPVSLEKAGNNRFKAVAPTGVVFALELPLSVSSGGEIEGDADSITIPAGAVESTSLSVTRTSEAGPAVTVDIGTLPSLPSAHSGYVFEKDSSLPRTVLPSLGSSETRLSDLSLGAGALDPVFDPDTSRYTATVPHAVASITVTPATSNQNATAAFRDGSDAALPDADTSADGHQVSLSSGENVIKVVVTAENRTSVRTYTLVMTREASICTRTDAVVDAIVQAVSGVDSCGYVSKAQLAGITTLDLSAQSIASLQSGDFAGLSALQTLWLQDNQLTALPADIFSELAALETLGLWSNQLESLPANVFSGLGRLRKLYLYGNRLTGLSAGIFSGLSQLETLLLSNNRIASLPANVFSGLSSLEDLYLNENQLTRLPAGVFSGLSSLTDLRINVNALASLPSSVFSGLSSLESLFLNHNKLTSLRANEFAGLSALQTLFLQANAFTSVPAGLLSGLSSLQDLQLSANRLTALPDGFFAGVTNLRAVHLRDHLGNPMPIPVSLEKVGADRFKAVAPTGALFAYTLSLSVGSDGEIEGGADSITIPAGAVQSGSLGVTRTSEAGPAITVDISALPALPASHYGYVLEKDATLPRAIVPAKRAAPPAQVTGVAATPGVESLEVSWTAVSDAGGYKVQWKSGEEDYAASRQAVISAGATASHTITALTAGTEYTVRVIATKQHADDGSPSDEVRDTPRAVSPAQVTGLELTPGEKQLDVSWTAVSGAGGYKVQWKSGEEDYAASRQAVITAGATTSHTITGLTAGTEYTVRVIATKANADDGAPSDNATGTPRSVPPAQVTGLEVTVGESKLDLSWTAVSGAGGYKVQWKSGDEGYDEARQSVITAGATSHTITGLTGGTEYTVRVIATKANADDGPASDEVTGAPQGTTPGQVTGLEVAAGTNRLAVSWTAVSGAGGYTVQWKSGDEDYDDSRQSVITTGATTSHTITGLTAGTEYTVRVIATKANVDDGPASDDVKGTPLAVAVLSSFSLSDGTLDPAFASGTTRYKASVVNAVSSITVAVTTNLASATVAFRDENDAALPDADANTDGHQVSLSSGENVIKVVVTAQDGGSVRTYTLVMTRQASICTRTDAIVDAIVQAVSGVDSCGYVSKAQLADITTLDLSAQSITSLKSGDFAGLSALETLLLDANRLTALPADVFAGLAALERLELQNNQLQSVPGNVFSGLSSLERLRLGGNFLASLPSGVFSGLSSLERILLNGNSLTNLPSGVFSGLSSLERIRLNGNSFASLPSSVFSGLSSLQILWLHNNSLTSLPAGLFNGLSALGDLRLAGNRLTTLPNGLFTGLTNLGTLTLGGNTVNPMPLSVSLEKVGTRQFKAVAPAGAPFRLVLPVSSAGGTINGSATTVTIAAGAVQSAAVGVNRASGDTGAVTVDIGTLPALPTSHSGYALQESAALPLEILMLRAGQVTGVEITAGDESLEVRWTAVTDADGYKVQWKSGAENYAASRQAVITAGATTSYTITGLTAGTEYTVRVIATAEDADDGTPSQDVSATPNSTSPDVTGIGVLNGNGALIMYYAYAYPDRVGNGRTGGTVTLRARFLAGYSGKSDPSDEELRAMVLRANAWRAAGVSLGGDINGDAVIDESDARAMYHSYTNEALLGNGENGGAARFRRQLLGPLAGKAVPTDEDLKAMLLRANSLREEFRR